ncbi:tetratricopeptide repeat protein [Candidatus Marithrix sp. Canyon 246]|uniref:tetratricopeptide repeat protein n=1 Tax=Candidatus Marithrix sp. Canyon 246 TaxID=1827136 RepID=UPI00084A23CB|nr:tetratricopeptide repeat protein [Candidatus Marithrix sp. Canyon 246]
MKITNILKKTYIQILALLIATLATYIHTLDVPFYLDDFSSIQENPIIYHWQGTIFEIWNTYKLRVVGYLSFALNYQFHQFQVQGYHLINIFIHLLTGIAIFALVRGLIATPALKNNQTTTWLPIIVALIFLLNPLQIQAVTYIVQRIASLAAFFYIAAMASYIQARLNPKPLPTIIWTLTSIAFAILALLTKQNTVTLPIALLLLELIFFPGHIRRFILTIISSLIALFIIWYIIATIFNLDPLSLKSLEVLSRETTNISRYAYFATQTKVLWTYISLFFWPISSHIDYAYPISQGFFTGTEHYNWLARIMHSQEFWALIGHISLLIIAAYNLRKRPLIAFGIFFYYLAHGIESSFIPIKDVIFEHRTYLPNLGLASLCAYILVVKIPQYSRIIPIITITIILILGTATWQRNQMWREPVALWQHNVEQSPKKKRAWNILGKHLVQQGKQQQRQGKIKQSKISFHKAIKALQRSIHKQIGTSISITPETALNLIVAYKSLRQYNNALMWVNNSLSQRHKLGKLNHAKFLVNKGNIYFELGRENHKKAKHQKAKQLYLTAKKAYEQALKIDKNNLKAQINLGNIFVVTGQRQKAIPIYKQVLKINPSNARVRNYLKMLQN